MQVHKCTNLHAAVLTNNVGTQMHKFARSSQPCNRGYAILDRGRQLCSQSRSSRKPAYERWGQQQCRHGAQGGGGDEWCPHVACVCVMCIYSHVVCVCVSSCSACVCTHVACVFHVYMFSRCMCVSSCACVCVCSHSMCVCHVYVSSRSVCVSSRSMCVCPMCESSRSMCVSPHVACVFVCPHVACVCVLFVCPHVACVCPVCVSGLRPIMLARTCYLWDVSLVCSSPWGRFWVVEGRMGQTRAGQGWARGVILSFSFFLEGSFGW